ncbi:MOSC domain-containing protein [Phaeobacter gallaeciensis]|uniref:MOSC domain-containing protein n=1 Tax=Phaeobacter gallaeciensis TaxID=60890 RepID=UPI0023808F6C|nr:MOSC N-terminal beta barrel domain-containing protein [Phaeobacter gallaeciensis]MDE4276588.1 MOSC domain-containing protein [Phaeobacter gallaeciensis]MDE4301776.1 MOSC domain-containing protein [Phaeobacter gallaeciensis]MDE5186971.1 MOSC domain-containing protein [Phaeobacter gallaeciensis]
MTDTVTEIWRHPVKSHGREALETVTLTAGQTMPGDRVWAVAHEASTADGSAWVPCSNFSRGAKAPQLMAIDASYDEATGHVTLRHPSRGELTFDPDAAEDLPRFLDWVAPLMPAERAASARIVRVPGRGMTDTDFPSVSLCNLASHRAVEAAIGHELSPQRWRGNIWFDLGTPWVENEWLGREVQIGEAVFAVRERTRRCMATTANPATGERDAETLKTLNSAFGHQDFSVYAEVVRGGTIRLGDLVKVL